MAQNYTRKANECATNYDKNQRCAKEYIFGAINSPEDIHLKIDLHGLHSNEAIDTVKNRLNET